MNQKAWRKRIRQARRSEWRPGYPIRDEINLRRYETGTVGVALSSKDIVGGNPPLHHSPQPILT
jgi:hypothetical protein